MELIVICVLAAGACATVLMSNGLDNRNDGLGDEDDDCDDCDCEDDDGDDDCDCDCHDDWQDDED